MPTPTYTALANITLGSAASTITFSSIPATYRDLVLVMAERNTTDDVGFVMRFNGDSGSNYNYVLARGGDIGGVVSNQASSQTQMFVGGWSFGNGTSFPAPITIDIMDYSATDKHKTVLDRFQTRRNDGSGETGMMAGRWASTSAITTILLYPTSSIFAANTTVALYGIAS